MNLEAEKTRLLSEVHELRDELERIKALALPPRSMEFLRADGSSVILTPAQPSSEPDGWEIERDVLLDLLYERVQHAVEFRFDDSIATGQPTSRDMDKDHSRARILSRHIHRFPSVALRRLHYTVTRSRDKPLLQVPVTTRCSRSSICWVCLSC